MFGLAYTVHRGGREGEREGGGGKREGGREGKEGKRWREGRKDRGREGSSLWQMFGLFSVPLLEEMSQHTWQGETGPIPWRGVGEGGGRGGEGGVRGREEGGRLESEKAREKKLRAVIRGGG